MELWLQALLMGLLSGVSLPIGAFLGDWFAPVRQDLVAGCMAFGAGSLLFAVTVELYAEAMHEAESQKGMAHIQDAKYGMTLMVVSAAVGAVTFLWLNKKLEAYIESKTPEDHHAHGHFAAAEASVDPECSPRIPTERSGLQASTSSDKLATRRSRSTLAVEAHAKPSLSIAFAMWLGVLVDGLPEGVLLGFLAAKKQLHMVLVISLFIANFPEAFASASIMSEAGMARWKIIGLWTLIFLLTGCLCGASCLLLTWISPTGHLSREAHFGVEAVEGLTAGAMLACIAGVMLPEAFERSGKDFLALSSGFLCTAGFLCAVLIKIYGGEVHEWLYHEAEMRHFPGIGH